MKSALPLLFSSILAFAAFTSCCDESWHARKKAAAISEAARVQTAQFHFLATNPGIWEYAHANRLATLTQSFDRTKRLWDREMRGARGSPDVKNFLYELRRTRAEIQTACAAVDNLIPEGRAQLDAWQAKKWAGYPLPVDFAATTDPDRFAVPDNSPDTPQKRAEANFWAYRESLQGPLRREIHQRRSSVDNIDARAALQTSLRQSGGIGSSTHDMLRSTHMRRIAPLQERLQSLYDDSEKLHAKWTAKNWNGYRFKDLPASARVKIPLPGSAPDAEPQP